MKKFYSAALLVVLFFGCGSQLLAQVTYSTVAAGGNITNVATWVGGIQPPQHSPCNNCTIYINGTVTDDLYDINITGNSTIYITSGSSLILDEWAELLDNTAVIVESNASLYVNDQLNLNGHAYVQLSDATSVVNANNDVGNPVSGPFGGATHDPTQAGIYYDARGAFGSTNINDYDFILTQIGYGNPTGPNFSYNAYNFSCSSPNICGTGLVYGPSVTGYSATDQQYEFIAATPLPVTLVQFLAEVNADQTVLLSWTTAQETNSDYYEVERSADGANWISIGTVKAKGFSSISTNYSLVDKTPLSGTSYYRLKMVDRDASFKYSKVIPVSINSSTQALVIYSNPFVDEIRLKINVGSSDNLSFILTDMAGRTYITQSYQVQPGDNFINLQPAGAASGLYMLSIKGNVFNQTVKLMKQ